MDSDLTTDIDSFFESSSQDGTPASDYFPLPWIQKDTPKGFQKNLESTAGTSNLHDADPDPMDVDGSAGGPDSQESKTSGSPIQRQLESYSVLFGSPQSQPHPQSPQHSQSSQTKKLNSDSSQSFSHSSRSLSSQQSSINFGVLKDSPRISKRQLSDDLVQEQASPRKKRHGSLEDAEMDGSLSADDEAEVHAGSHSTSARTKDKTGTCPDCSAKFANLATLARHRASIENPFCLDLDIMELKVFICGMHIRGAEMGSEIEGICSYASSRHDLVRKHQRNTHKRNRQAEVRVFNREELEERKNSHEARLKHEERKARHQSRPVRG